MLTEFINLHPFLFSITALWVLIWKGLALYKSARDEQKIWFVIFVVINTLGILEIAYIFYFSKNKKSSTNHKTEEVDSAKAEINYDDFSKIHLKVAKILEAEKVEKSEKLIKLQLELGEEKRQIVAGIGKSYSAEELVGKEIIIVANLEPKALMGIQSHGMLLAATVDERPVLLTPEKEVKTGIRVS